MSVALDRASAIEQNLIELRDKLKNTNLSAMESYNIVRAIVHWEQVLAQLD